MSPDHIRKGLPARAGRQRSVSIVLLGIAASAALLLGYRPGRVAAAEPTARAAVRQNGSGISVPMSVDWKFTGNAFINNPAGLVVDNGVGYYASGNRVYAVDLQNGNLKWKYPSEGVMSTIVPSTPVLSNGALYVAGGDTLYALNTADGKPKFAGYRVRGAISTSLIPANGNIYFGTNNNRLYAVKGDTGEPVESAWSPGGRPGIDIGNDIAGDISLAEGNLIFMTTDQAIHAINALTGIQKWAKQVQTDPRNVKPVIAGEYVLIANGTQLLFWRASNGQSLPSISLPADATAPPTVDENGDIFVPTVDRYIVAIDPHRHRLWHDFPRQENTILAQPIATNGLLIAGTSTGTIYAYDLTSGALRWSCKMFPSSSDPNNVPLTTAFATTPVLVGDTLYTLTDDGTLTAFRHDAVDNTAPTITRLDPDPGEYLNGRPPFRISARVADEGSGLNVDSLTMKLDDTPLRRIELSGQVTNRAGFLYDAITGEVSYTIIETGSDARSATLADGHHTVTITAKDWKGNVATKSWTFTVDDTIKGRARKSNPNGGIPGGGRPGFPGAGGGGGGKGAGGGAGAGGE